MFGLSHSEGILIGNGSSRWKQRAFYDFVKDASTLLTQIPVIRLSIYDTVKYENTNRQLNCILNDNDFETRITASKAIMKLINEQL